MKPSHTRTDINVSGLAAAVSGVRSHALTCSEIVCASSRGACQGLQLYRRCTQATRALELTALYARYRLVA